MTSAAGREVRLHIPDPRHLLAAAAPAHARSDLRSGAILSVWGSSWDERRHGDGPTSATRADLATRTANGIIPMTGPAGVVQ